MRVPVIAILASSLTAGCHGSDRDREWVARRLAERGASASGDERASLHARLAAGLDEDAAVAIALSHSPSYQADLARLAAARADLDEARRPANPQLTLASAFGPISAFATLLAPLESLWQLPRRREAALRALESVAESLVQSGLDLARDVRLSHLACALAEERVRIREELVAVWSELAALADERLRVGEASPVESAAVRAEAALAVDAREVSASELAIARAQLRTLLGLDRTAPRFAVRFVRAPLPLPPLPALVRIAGSARPDLRAAALSLEAALARAGWERSRIVAFAAQLEGHWTRPDVLAARAGARIELPLFGANPGGRGRAQAEILRSTALLRAARQRSLLEITRAHLDAQQAEASLARYRAEVLPALHTAEHAAQTSHQLGEETYVVVLDVVRRIGEARLREAELVAQTRRAEAELERAIGARIGASP